MIDAKPSFEGGYAFKGGDLILLDERGETVGAPVLQADLEVGKDDDVIRNHELTNMWVVPEKLRDRLIGFFEAGVNWDEYKERGVPRDSAAQNIAFSVIAGGKGKFANESDVGFPSSPDPCVASRAVLLGARAD